MKNREKFGSSHYQRENEDSFLLSRSRNDSVERGGNDGNLGVTRRLDRLVGSLVQNRSGFALLMTLAMVTVVLVFAIGVTNIVTSTLRGTAYVEQANEAFFAAEAGLEEGLYFNAQHEAGYVDGFGGPGTEKVDFGGENDALADWQIEGRAGCIDDPPGGAVCDDVVGADGVVDYFVPVPGTGNVGKDCDPLTPEAYVDLDHPCNWNKIHPGDDVAIPFYYDNGVDPDPVNFFEAASTFTLKVRTACADDAVPCARYTLDMRDLDPVDGFTSENDTILYWQISGECSDDDIAGPWYVCSLSPDDSKNPLTADPFDRFVGLNSEIFESLLNGSDEVLTNSSFGIDSFGIGGGFIRQFLTRTGPWDTAGVDLISKPLFKLSGVHTLYGQNQDTGVWEDIPYLEYQLVLNVEGTNVYQTITADGRSGGFKQALEIKKGVETGVMEFVIHQ